MYSKNRFKDLSQKEIYGLIFCSFLVVRLAFVFVLKTYLPQLEIFPDSERYDILSSQILEGNFNLDGGTFLVAPVYPYFLALVKMCFGTYWIWIAPMIQIGLSCLSGVYFYKLAKVLFESERVAVLGVLGYCFYPFSMWYVHSISQETIYQTLLIFSIYHFVIGLKNQKERHLIYSAILFSICFLTKSIILFYSPFLALSIYLYFNGNWKQKLRMVFIYSSICVVFTLPNGIYNWQTHGIYTISSGGFGFFLSLSNNDNISRSIGEYKYTKGLNEFDYAYGIPFELEQDPNVKKYPPLERDQLYLKEGLKWINDNPKKLFLLSLTKLQKFLLPGFSISHHPFNKWLISFLLGLPVYFFGYIGIWKGLKTNFKLHSWILFLIISMSVFSMFFLNQSRFRVVTMEGFYLMYAAFGWVTIFGMSKRKPKLFN
ncbi:MAG: ArnT family glycosyltransferase [Saprospiraceae bacterium]